MSATHPNLLRLVRFCAKWRGGVLILTTLMLAVGVFATPGNGGMVHRGGTRTPKPPPLAPAAVTDLRAQALSDSSVVLTWTEVRSSTTGIPRYVVRYGNATVAPFFSWATSSDVTTGGCAAPIIGSNATGGKPHACVLTGLAPNHAYDFQILPYTGVLNSTAVFGPLSNVTEATTMLRVGSVLVWRPRMWQDTLVISGIVTPFGTWQFNARVAFGDYIGSFTDSLGVTNGRGYLVVVKP